MSNRCLILGEGGRHSTIEELWQEILWLYVEEEVTEFVITHGGRTADLAADAIKSANARYSALRVVNLPWSADIRAAIDESGFLIICPGLPKRRKEIVDYAQARQAEGKLKIITISGD